MGKYVEFEYQWSRMVPGGIAIRHFGDEKSLGKTLSWRNQTREALEIKEGINSILNPIKYQLTNVHWIRHLVVLKQNTIDSFVLELVQGMLFMLLD